MVCIWCTCSLGRLNFLDLLLRHNSLVGGHPGPRKRADEQPLLLLVDTAIEGASPSHAYIAIRISKRFLIGVRKERRIIRRGFRKKNGRSSEMHFECASLYLKISSMVLPKGKTLLPRYSALCGFSLSFFLQRPRSLVFMHRRFLSSCLGIVSLEAHSQVAAAALCLCLSPGNGGEHMVHPLAWLTQLPGSPASPQSAGRWSPWTPEKSR